MVITHYFDSRHHPAFLPFQFVFCPRSGRPAPALVGPTGPCGQTEPSQLHSVTPGLPRGCAAPSYLGRCKAAGQWSAAGIWLHHTSVNLSSRVLLMDFFSAAPVLQEASNCGAVKPLGSGWERSNVITERSKSKSLEFLSVVAEVELLVTLATSDIIKLQRETLHWTCSTLQWPWNSWYWNLCSWFWTSLSLFQ